MNRNLTAASILMDMISKMTENQMKTPFKFLGNKGKKEAHWARDKNVRALFICISGIRLC